MLKWQKMGLVWQPPLGHRWIAHSALQPTPLVLNESVIRVFFGGRDDQGVSRIFFVDLDAKDPRSVLAVCDSPVLDIGEPGRFDENGVVPCAVLREGDGSLRLYYAGYMTPGRARFLVFSGLAISRDDGRTFVREKTVPVLERSDKEPLFRVVHSILKERDGYHAWYGAGDSFAQGKLKTLPIYNVRYTESSDGVEFPRSGSVAVDIQGKEHRVGRPYVVKINESKYYMFYGYGTEEAPYQLGMALSADGTEWTRADDQVGISLSKEGWDSQMMAYPAVVQTKYGTFMFYNGNDYGRFGFGVAKLDGTTLP